MSKIEKHTTLQDFSSVFLRTPVYLNSGNTITDKIPIVGKIGAVNIENIAFVIREILNYWSFTHNFQSLQVSAFEFVAKIAAQLQLVVVVIIENVAFTVGEISLK